MSDLEFKAKSLNGNMIRDISEFMLKTSAFKSDAFVKLKELGYTDLECEKFAVEVQEKFARHLDGRFKLTEGVEPIEAYRIIVVQEYHIWEKPIVNKLKKLREKMVLGGRKVG